MSTHPFSSDISSDWESYLCNVNESIASVYVDLSLSGVAPITSHSVLAWVFIRMKQPQDNGLSSDKEFDALCKYEDDLALAISQYDSYLYVGRVTTRGMRQFYFYIVPNVDFRTIVDEVLEKHQDYLFQVDQKHDALWDQYTNLLLPRENGWLQIHRRRADRETSDGLDRTE